MHVGQVNNNQSLNTSENSQKTAEHVQLSEENQAMVKQNSTDFLFELAKMKVQVRKESRTEFTKTSPNSDTEIFTKTPQLMSEEKKIEYVEVDNLLKIEILNFHF